jgi:hypothetical protein
MKQRKGFWMCWNRWNGGGCRVSLVGMVIDLKSTKRKRSVGWQCRRFGGGRVSVYRSFVSFHVVHMPSRTLRRTLKNMKSLSIPLQMLS